MTRVTRFRSTIAVTATFILVSLGLEIRDHLVPLRVSSGLSAWLGWPLAFILSVFLVKSGTSVLWGAAVRVRALRKAILGRTWVEGTWFIHTIAYVNGQRTTTQVGLAHFSYGLPDLSLECRVSSVMFDTREPIETEVIMLALDDNLRYLHRFVRYVGTVQTVGTAYGTFISDGGRPPQRYTGGAIYLDTHETHKLTQTAVKLSESDVPSVAQAFGDDWERKLLSDSAWVARFCEICDPSAGLTTEVTSHVTTSTVSAVKN